MMIGWPHNCVSTTHAGFAAALLSDCADELLALSRSWDSNAYSPPIAGVVLPAVTMRARNRRELIVAGAYAQWIGDAIRWEASPGRRTELVLRTPNPDMPAAARLLLGNIVPEVSQLHRVVDDVVDPGPVPPVPAELVDADTLDHRSRARFSRVRGWLVEAAAAVAVSTAAEMTALAEHISALMSWLDPYLPQVQSPMP